MTKVSIRAYEQKNLPIEKRLPSLAKRFECLKNMPGLEPWNTALISDWIKTIDSVASKQGALLLLGLAGVKSDKKFDLFIAMKSWTDSDRQMFVNLLRIWSF